MKEAILLTSAFTVGIVLTTLFEAKIKAFVVALLTKTAAKIGNKSS